jgi:HD-GYP domain-containing protein (c-di-GMP phosphodiesterase class II)
VLFRILRPDGEEVARVADPAYAGADALAGFVAREAAPARVAPERAEVAPVDVGGGAALRALAPLRDRSGAVVAVAEGFFVATPEAHAAARARLLRAVAIAAGTVLLTTALLYPILRGLLRRLGALSVQLLDSNLQVVGSAIAKRDSDTDAHNYRVTIYAARIGEALGLDDAAMRGLVKGAMLHDVGKIGIRDDILLKPGRLDEREFAVMQAHVRHGLDIVNRASWLRDAAPIVGAHHEKYDGTGYFAKLAGSEIPLAARIFAVADVFDAVTSHRPYHEPLDFESAMALLEAGRGRHFDPVILDVFAEIAESLHAQYADRDDERLRSDHAAIVERYYRTDLTAFLP